MVNDVFYEGIKAVTDVIVKPGLINLDFADVRTITEGPGWGIMGSGFAEGHGKAEAATLAALDNPLLSDTSKRNATGVLVSITGGPDLAILEIDEILRYIRAEVSEEANVIFGATSDEEMKGAIRVSLILTGPYSDNENPILQPVEPVAAQQRAAPASPVHPPPAFSQESPRGAKTANPRPSQVFQVAPSGEQLASYPPSSGQLNADNSQALRGVEQEFVQQTYRQNEQQIRQPVSNDGNFRSASDQTSLDQQRAAPADVPPPVHPEAQQSVPPPSQPQHARQSWWNTWKSS